jgi:hypothetical protein
MGLWQARDDCHMAAWQQADSMGRRSTRSRAIWRAEATSEEDLAAKLTSQRPSDVAAELARLRRDGSSRLGIPRDDREGCNSAPGDRGRDGSSLLLGWPDECRRLGRVDPGEARSGERLLLGQSGE